MVKKGTRLNGIRELTFEQGQEMIDRLARRYLGISGAEFIRKWDAGDYDQEPECLAAMRIGMLLPFAR